MLLPLPLPVYGQNNLIFNKFPMREIPRADFTYKSSVSYLGSDDKATVTEYTKYKFEQFRGYNYLDIPPTVRIAESFILSTRVHTQYFNYNVRDAINFELQHQFYNTKNSNAINVKALNVIDSFIDYYPVDKTKLSAIRIKIIDAKSYLTSDLVDIINNDIKNIINAKDGKKMKEIDNLMSDVFDEVFGRPLYDGLNKIAEITGEKLKPFTPMRNWKLPRQ